MTNSNKLSVFKEIDMGTSETETDFPFNTLHYADLYTFEMYYEKESNTVRLKTTHKTNGNFNSQDDFYQDFVGKKNKKRILEILEYCMEQYIEEFEMLHEIS